MLLIINNLFLRSNYTSIPPPVESLSDSTGLSFVWVWISDHFSLIFVGYFWFRRFLLLLWLESFQILFGRFYLLLGSYILWQEPWSATICSLVDHWSFILQGKTIKLSPPALLWLHRHNKLSGIIVTEEEAPPTMFAYPTSPSSGQICVRLTDTQPVTWCDREMECWRQCLRRSPPSDHQGPGATKGHQGNLLHKTPGASWTFPVSQHLQGRGITCCANFDNTW